MNMGDFWVFGYGSLMWNPGFTHDDAVLARLYGYQRALCIYSTHHRGTPEKPGLVLGLDSGGSTLGMAFHVAQKDAEETYQYLLKREQPTGVYCEKHLPLHLDDGRKVKALTFIADKKHRQFAGKLSASQMAEIVKNAEGLSGKNCDYVLNTVQLLRSKNIHDAMLEDLASLLES